MIQKVLSLFDSLVWSPPNEKFVNIFLVNNECVSIQGSRFSECRLAARKRIGTKSFFSSLKSPEIRTKAEWRKFIFRGNITAQSYDNICSGVEKNARRNFNVALAEYSHVHGALYERSIPADFRFNKRCGMTSYSRNISSNFFFRVQTRFLCFAFSQTNHVDHLIFTEGTVFAPAVGSQSMILIQSFWRHSASARLSWRFAGSHRTESKISWTDECVSNGFQRKRSRGDWRAYWMKRWIQWAFSFESLVAVWGLKIDFAELLLRSESEVSRRITFGNFL